MEITKLPQNYNKNVTYAIGLYQLIAQYLGIWCLTCENAVPKIQVSIMCTLMVTMAISLFNEMNPKCGVDNETFKPYSLAMCNILALTKILSIRLNHKKMQQIINSVIDDWSIVSNNQDLESMKRTAQFSRNICIYQMTMSFVSSLPMLLCGFANPTDTNNATEMVKLLPLPNQCFYRSYLPNFYILLYILQCLQLFSTIIGNVGCDCYFFGFTMHLVGQLQLLADKIEEFKPVSDPLKDRHILQIFIKKHCHLMNLVAYLEDTFYIVAAIQVAANFHQVCLIGLQILINLRREDFEAALNFFIFSILVMLQIFVYCYAGESLSSGIRNLQSSFYSSLWYDISPNTRKDFVFVMLRCSKKFHLTAGKILIMNLDSFKHIIKTLGSYFSVIRTMLDE